MNPIPIPAYVQALLDRLEAAGQEAWVVGGCVRDSLLGREPGDWDLCTAAIPQKVKAALGDMPTADVGISHGTVTALTAGGPVEITTYRREGAYSDHRRPDRVSFTQDIGEDLCRRDFTVNAMAYHPDRGLLDPFGGREDLSRRVLRCVGDPARRFQEDALRMLRCVRFAAVLGFQVEGLAQKALDQLSPLLAAVSRERARGELTRLLLGDYASQALALGWQAVRAVMPELPKWPAAFPPGIPGTLPARWARLLWPMPLGQAEAALEGLRFPHTSRREVLALLACRDEPLPMPPSRVKELLARLGPLFFQLVGLRLAGASPGERAGLEAARAQAQALLDGGACLSLRNLAVTGHDLLALGCPPGPEVGRVLRALLGQVLSDALPNRREELLAYAARLVRPGLLKAGRGDPA